MSTKYRNQKILAILAEKINFSSNTIEYDSNGNSVGLNLSNMALSELPPEIGQLTNLQALYLNDNQFSQVPPEIGQLINLRQLYLNNNQLSHIPSEIGRLVNLQRLDLNNNQLNQLPSEIGQLTGLQTLRLDSNQLSQVPPEIGQLTNLQRLYLDHNQLFQVPPEIGQLTNLQTLHLNNNQLRQIPPEISQLINLQRLYLGNNKLGEIPSEIGRLTTLQTLYLNNNQLSQVPPEISQLINLQTLHLSNNQLSQVPPEMGQLINLQTLYLSNNQLSRVPSKMGQLTRLQQLYLNNNQLDEVPAEIGQLTTLQTLYLNNNQLGEIPAEIGQLTTLQQLYLDNNQLHQVPREIGQLTNLPRLDLDHNQLGEIPAEIGQLTNLQRLYLDHNQLGEIPAEIGQLTNLQRLYLDHNQLNQVASKIGQLTNLQTLYLDSNQLIEIPAEIGQLTNLQMLRLDNNQLNQLPAEIGRLTNLQQLALDHNQLRQVPPEIGQLIYLQTLYLNNNQLGEIPAEIGRLANLQQLALDHNQLRQVPCEIGQLTYLQELYLNNNQLRQVPPEIGQLANLRLISVVDNIDLSTPPPEIVAQGTQNMLAFLRELQESSITRYESKLLIVGEAGTGKSSLLRALRNDAFKLDLPPTHGIEINSLHLTYTPYDLTLNTWDFGGQHIYHATHQIFLTNRSLYIVVWNARDGAEQGKLDYWLDTIKTLAPKVPVLLVATHIDLRPPDLNYQLYKDAYPQLVGHLGVSNRNRTGIAELKEALAEQALRLPLMGQSWPQKWLDVETLLAQRPEQHIDAHTYMHYCSTCGVEEDIARGTLGNYLHDLGKILYFRDKDEYLLSNLVFLKPNWVTKAISRVLDDDATSKAKGVLHHSELPRIWSKDESGKPYEASLYYIFLRLTERFELSFQIEADAPAENATRSLIPLLLPHQPPESLPPWPAVLPKDQSQVEMVYRLGFVPAGIMSRFIVRTHRYTKNLHWREGVMLEYEGNRARVELNPMLRELRLLVRGRLPQIFFNILLHTIDLILARFEGLIIRREIPCLCHWERKVAEPCSRFYRYEDLVRRMEAGKRQVECPDTFVQVSVPLLLYGIHSSTNEQVIDDIKLGQQEIQKQLVDLNKLDTILGKINQQSELIGRSFTRQWNLEMAKIEADCPNTFILVPSKGSRFNPENWVSQKYHLFLVCQHPPHPHPVEDFYPLQQAEEWWVKMRPWLNNLIKFLKFGVPMGRALGTLIDEVDIKKMQNALNLMEEITGSFSELPTLDLMDRKTTLPILHREQEIIGPALRALYSYLDDVDHNHIWGKLHKTVTPDGHILWLCEKDRKQYEAKPLHLEA